MAEWQSGVAEWQNATASPEIHLINPKLYLTDLQPSIAASQSTTTRKVEGPGMAYLFPII